LGTIAALTLFASQYDNVRGVPLTLRVVTDAPALWTPAQAIEHLRGVPPVRQHPTGLSEAPVWFAFTPDEFEQSTVIDFPSRHATELSCWSAAGEFLGRANYSVSVDALARAKAGFALKLDHPRGEMVCRGSFVGPASVSVEQWDPVDFAQSAERYSRKSGLLDGGLLVMTCFVALIALVSKESLYLLFASWLCLNVRVAAISAGWDTQWLGQEIPSEYFPVMRAVTIALLGIVTGHLYRTIFADALRNSRLGAWVNFASWGAVTLLPASLLLPFRSFLPYMWVCAGIGMLILLASLVFILANHFSRVAVWFTAAFAASQVSQVIEVIDAALGAHIFGNTLNSVTAALAASVLTAIGVAERVRQQQEQWLQAKAELEHTYAVSPIGLFTMDRHGHVISANPAAREMSGGRDPDVAWWADTFHDDAWARLQAILKSSGEIEIELRSKDDTRTYLIKARMSNSRIEGILQDVTTQAQATRNLLYQANHDPLTRVLNRRGIEAAFNKVMANILPNETLAVAYLDLDRFKLINDLFGHAAGDNILCQVCTRTKAILARDHYIGRIGGDEFMIIMPATSIALASVIAQAIVAAIGNSSYRVSDKAFTLRGSIGLVEIGSGMELKDVISSASRACQQAKTTTGHGLVIYEKDASAFAERLAELEMMEQLAAPNATSALFLEMQPIMSLRSPETSLNFEVLLRMKRRDGKVAQAGQILAVAEKGGLMGMIDRWVLATTLDWVNANKEALSNTQFICMNLSGASLNDEQFVQDALDLLQDNLDVAKLLCIEITESVALHDLGNTRRFIDQIRAYGTRVALDDFGAGYTSFSYLKELPADVLKIDGNFIVQINRHPANVSIVEAIVSLAQNLGMRTIAEWAEDAATVETLAAIGVDYVQGYAIARPQLPERILAAHSAASFITNQHVANVVSELVAVPSGATNVIRLYEPHEQR
jgi:diguanylate cyclase (GGDEF)-like protein